jgi:hypothetical protein|tara:strand:+ start:308 stop:736 length:429 start_codon:yes stop_codon:yes gene_type:complete
MAKLNSVALNPESSVEGIWVTYMYDIELKIARLGNSKYKEYAAKLLAPFVRESRGKVLPDERLEKVTKPAVANCILVDWRNIQNDDGTEFEYSPEKALEILSDDKYVDLYEFVMLTSGNSEIFRAELQEDSAGNLEKSSSGN